MFLKEKLLPCGSSPLSLLYCLRFSYRQLGNGGRVCRGDDAGGIFGKQQALADEIVRCRGDFGDIPQYSISTGKIRSESATRSGLAPSVH